MERRLSARKAGIAFALAGLIALGGCTSSELPGQYETSKFLVVSGADTVDVLSAGGFIKVTLHEDSTAEGRIFGPEEVPALGGTGQDVNVRFDGTYTVSGSQVTFEHDADTFVKETIWTLEDGTLRTHYADALFIELKKP